MKVLFITMQFGPGYTQGAERYVGTLAGGLRDRGHEVACLAGDPLALDARRCLGEPRPTTDLPVYAYPTRGWNTVVGLSPERLARWLEQQRPDVVHVANPAHVGVGAMLACRQLNIPLVVTTMDYWWICPKSTLLRGIPAERDPQGEGREAQSGGREICAGTANWPDCVRCMAADHPRRSLRWLGRLPRALSPLVLGIWCGRAALRGMGPADMLRWLNRREVLLRCLNAAGAVIFPSQAMRDLIQPRLTHDRCQVVPYGLSGEWFRDPRPPRTGPAPPTELTIGYAGALQPHKAPHLLLEAIAGLGWTRTQVLLAGALEAGGYVRGLRARAAGFNVHFLGQVAREEMPAFFRRLDVLVLTSLWPENLPLVVLEAQAAGVPVVASRVPGVREQVPPELTFVPGSVTGLTGALERVRQHPAIPFLGRVDTAEQMTDATLQAYRAALKRRG